MDVTDLTHGKKIDSLTAEELVSLMDTLRVETINNQVRLSDYLQMDNSKILKSKEFKLLLREMLGTLLESESKVVSILHELEKISDSQEDKKKFNTKCTYAYLMCPYYNT
jgi:hypothetical protein